MTRKEVEEMLDKELQHNKVLAEIIKDDPKKKEMYIAKFLDEEDAMEGNPVIIKNQCTDCIFSKSDVIAENGPLKGWCWIYSKESGNPKPMGFVKDKQKCPHRKVVKL